MSFLGRAPLPDSVLLELVGLLYSSAFPIMIVGGALTGVGAFAFFQYGDMFVAELTIFAGVLTLLRLSLIWAFRRRTETLPLTAPEACRWEGAYLVGSIAFAVCLATLSSRILVTGSVPLQIMATSLLFGYCAGMVTRVAIRPWICIPSTVVATTPIVATLLWRGGLDDAVLAGFLMFFLVASFETVAHSHRTALALISSKQQLGALARRDHLTGLPNRLALLDAADAAVRRLGRGGAEIAVHCLDLDRFKPVNDRYGHPVGDELLKTVARRLEAAIRPEDAAIRVGGDEFIIVQTDAPNAAAAEMLARRIIRAVSAPYMIEGVEIRIGVSVGIALAPKDGSTVQDLIARADQALYHAKAQGRDGFRFYDAADGQVGSEAMVAAWKRKEPA
ncbi:GGDEF domain-containing protein [Hansschlegelia sp.]|uniref:GGDEF domain-containing protein n=1 Tax=Hansschlegelia sp. TaxID=2041892 RepID=UPI002C4DAE0C|nr:GGDEF domain-containing protein [Hansschlegelia sp.]HVI30320.1 GGDEF domain-containing protein [Hansschlegelia sp.]